MGVLDLKRPVADAANPQTATNCCVVLHRLKRVCIKRRRRLDSPLNGTNGSKIRNRKKLSNITVNEDTLVSTLCLAGPRGSFGSMVVALLESECVDEKKLWLSLLPHHHRWSDSFVGRTIFRKK